MDATTMDGCALQADSNAGALFPWSNNKDSTHTAVFPAAASSAGGGMEEGTVESVMMMGQSQEDKEFAGVCACVMCQWV
jgi:hypothetical protein